MQPKTMEFQSRVIVLPSKKRRTWIFIVKASMAVLVLSALFQTMVGDTSVRIWAQAVVALAVGSAFLKNPENAPHALPSGVKLVFTESDIAVSYQKEKSGVKPFHIAVNNIAEVVFDREITCMQIKFVKKVKESSNQSSHFVLFPKEVKDELIDCMEQVTRKAVTYETT